MTSRRVLVVLSCLAALLAACAPTRHPAPPTVDVSASVTQVALIAEGTQNGVRWRVDLVSVAGELCTRATVDDRPAGQGCEPPVSAQAPVNVALDALDPRILLLYGAAAPTVARLTAAPPRPVPLTAPHGGRSFFAYATTPGTATDLTAFDTAGRRLWSAADKIRDFEAP
ncbi:hypothetical protein TR51_03365 [Kitasatospora griseola]|uniref:Lipoprotein n=1 Tax=Kitasatospora griseola TaxID=2064 RepID=A0A0D0NEC0_KITGR|nr:hypothetical protein [Kitasatospora griseola]KIQ66590.1 hypothetical protein TR51_03365 [Kitasatospora griseola]